MLSKAPGAPDFVHDIVVTLEEDSDWDWCEYSCEVDGEYLYRHNSAGCRWLFVYEDMDGSKWVIKVDADGLLQSESEYLFWRDIEDSEDANLFVPTVAAGPVVGEWETSMTGLYYPQPYWCVQPFIEFDDLHGNHFATAKSIDEYIRSMYEIKDMSLKQFKVTADGQVLCHDYGVNSYSDDYEDY